MKEQDDQFEVKPGRSRDRGASAIRSKSFVNQVMAATAKAGHAGYRFGQSGRLPATSRFGRGRFVNSANVLRSTSRRVVIKARVVRHRGTRYRAAPLARHISYLQREGVARDGNEPELFGRGGVTVDGDAFAERCEDDRHHFRFIVSPEDGVQLDDLKGFAVDLMAQAERDLGTKLDWAGIDHWNTDQPHVHILVRGRADDGNDLVISKDYISGGFRARVEEMVTLELGPRNELEIQSSLERDVGAQRWTGLDRALQIHSDENAGLVDLRLSGSNELDPAMRNLLIGRAQKLEQMELATKESSSVWRLKPGLETELRDLAVRGDIINTMHKAMRGRDERSVGDFDIHARPDNPIIGRLADRGLHNELTGSAYVVIDGTDGRVHHLRFPDLEASGKTPLGGIVEAQMVERKSDGKPMLRLYSRSELSLDQQVRANTATWLDRQLVGRNPQPLANSGFGQEVGEALNQRSEQLVERGLARRQGQRIIFIRDLLDTLKQSEVERAIQSIASQTGLEHQPAKPGEIVSGLYRQRIDLAAGRFAMLDAGTGFELVPWKPELEPYLGKQLNGVAMPGGGIEWELGRGRGIGR
jgi:type IV secretory pathway VirD2 relaxase